MRGTLGVMLIAVGAWFFTSVLDTAPEMRDTNLHKAGMAGSLGTRGTATVAEGD